jgi:hypothetical protein
MMSNIVPPPWAITFLQAADWSDRLLLLLFQQFYGFSLRITISCYYHGRLRPKKLAKKRHCMGFNWLR